PGFVPVFGTYAGCPGEMQKGRRGGARVETVHPGGVGRPDPQASARKSGRRIDGESGSFRAHADAGASSNSPVLPVRAHPPIDRFRTWLVYSRVVVGGAFRLVSKAIR